MFDKAMRKSVEPYLEPGEEILALVVAQAKGAGKAMILGGAAGAGIHAALQSRKGEAEADAALRMARRMGLVITPKRLLVFKGGGQVTTKATELLSDIPIADVEGIEVGKGMATKPITITVHGQAFVMEAPRAAPSEELPQALERARGMSRV